MSAALPDDLAALEAAVWRELGSATTERGHGWRIGVLATVDGEAADARSVVLRDCDAASRQLLIYTDARSPKVAQMAAHPLGTLVLWSPALNWQLRLRVQLGLESDGLALSSRWARVKMTPAAQDYMTELPPGATLQDGPLTAPARRSSRDHFAVITAEVLTMDWLEIDPRGHRRAVFDAGSRRWVTP